jgi:hypothetical protein
VKRVHQIFLGALAMSGSVLAGCTGGTASPGVTVSIVAPSDPTTSTTSTTTTVAPTTTSAPALTFPELGTVDPDGLGQTRPALWVKIENTRPARPQAGLDVADVVFEQVTEGGITRFVTLFQSQIPDVVGPIRSTRAMDGDVVSGLRGVFAYSGGIPQSVALIQQAPVAAIDESAAGSAMYRDHSKSAPHNLYGRGPALEKLGSDQPTPPPPLFSYLQPSETFAGEPAASVTVRFDPPYRPTYTYDPATNTWPRSIGSSPFVAASGQQIAPTNVIVQFVDCCLDVPEGGIYKTLGGGDAWVFSDGKVAKGTWGRADRSQPTTYLDTNGQPIRLRPGRTWVEFVPNGTDATVPAPSTP